MVAAGSKGLGFGIVQALLAEGAKVSFCSRSEEHIAAAISSLPEEVRPHVRGYVADVTDSDSLEQWVQSTIDDLGDVSILVTNAGGPPGASFSQLDDQQWYAAFELNLLSVVRMVRLVTPSLQRVGGGAILGITSSTVKEPHVHMALSNVMRSGVSSLLKTLSRDLASDSIRVNNIIPGRIATDRVAELDALSAGRLGISPEEVRRQSEQSIPLGRYGEVDEFAKAVVFLVSDAARYVTGSTFVVDGGMLSTV
jgi:3-oxoacyl-[acyl-carrier protein] reductase